MLCPQCGKSNDISAKFCFDCGTLLSQVEIKASDEQEEFYRAVIGPKNQDYYMRNFQRFENDGEISVSWHWPAFFVTFYWLLYRKMWLNALIYFLLPYLVLIPLEIIIGMIAGDSAGVGIGFANIIYLVGMFLLPPLYANALYYKHCKKKIMEVKASSNVLQRQLGELSAKGGTSNVVLIIVLIFVFIAMIGILAAIAIPAYQDYTIRARLMEASSVGNTAAESVANYVYQYQKIPSNLEDAGFVASLPSSVKKIDVNSEDGTVTITMATAPIEGGSLLLLPSLDANNKITWKCMSQDIPARYLPRQCRQKQ